MKPILLTLFFIISLALPAGADEWTRLDADEPTEEWTDFRREMAQRPWVMADFVEQRVFPFRSRPVELQGTVWYGRKEGLTLNYRSPRREVVRVDEKGVRIIQDDGSSRERAIPERGREVPSALLATFRLDFGELKKDFEIHEQRDGDDWALRLTPHDQDETGIQRIVLEGVEEEVRRIVIEQSDRRRIELTFSGTVYPRDLDAAERARIFP